MSSLSAAHSVITLLLIVVTWVCTLGAVEAWHRITLQSQVDAARAMLLELQTSAIDVDAENAETAEDYARALEEIAEATSLEEARTIAREKLGVPFSAWPKARAA